MPIELIATAFDLIVGQGVELAKDKAKRSERILKVLNAIGLKQDAPPANDFDGVYAYTLVVYGIDKPKSILEFFRHEFIKSAFRKSYEERDSSILEDETENFLDWNQIGKDIRAIDYDPRREFAEFRDQFFVAAKLTRTVQEVFVDHKLDDISDKIQELPTREELESLAITIRETGTAPTSNTNIHIEGDAVFANNVYQFPVTKKKIKKKSGNTHRQILLETFIGREEETKRIAFSLHDSFTHCICIYGFAGVGKSALLRETVRIASKENTNIIGGGVITLGSHETLTGLIVRITDLDERSRLIKSDYEILSKFMEDYLTSSSVIAIDEIRTQDTKLIADLNWFLETVNAAGRKVLIITASREKPLLKSTLPVEYIQLQPFEQSQTGKLILELTTNEEIRKGSEHIFLASQGFPQLVKYICKNEDVARKILQNSPVDFDILKEVWGSIRDSSFARTIEFLSVFNVFSKEIKDKYAQDLILEWGSEKEKLIDRSLIDQIQPKLYKIHDLLANYVYDNLTKVKKTNIHNMLGKHFSSQGNDSESIVGFNHFVAAEEVDEAVNLYAKLREILKQTTYSPLLINSLLKLKSIIKNDNLSLRAQVLESLGYIYVLTDDYKESEVNWIEAKSLFEQTNDKRGLAWSVHGLAIINRMRANFSLSLQDYKLAEENFRAIGDTKGTAWSLRDQSEILRSIGKYDEALKTATQSLRLSRSIDDQLGVAATLRTIGDLYFTQSKFDDAFMTYSEALSISEQIDAKMSIGYVLNAISHLFRITHKIPEAIDYSKKSLRVLYSIQDKAGICFSKFGLAEGFRMEGNFSEALDEYLSANQIAYDIGHNDFASYNLLGIAELYRTIGDYPKALLNSESALDYSRRYNIKIVEAHSLLSMGEINRLSGKAAVDLYDQAYSLYKEIKSTWGIIHVLIGKALATETEEGSLKKNLYLNQAKSICNEKNYIFELQFIGELKPNDVHTLIFPLM